MSSASETFRIAFVASSATFGGAEFYLAQLLTRLPPRFDRVLVGVGHLPERLVAIADEAGVDVVETPDVRGKLDVVNQVRLWRTLRRTRADVAHVNLAAATNNRWAVATAVFARLPVVVTLHLRHDVGPGIQRRILQAAFSRVRAAIAVAEEVAEQLREELSVPADRVVVVPNGVARDRPRAGLGAGPGAGTRGVRVGAVGRLEEQTGFDGLVEAARILQGRTDGFEVVIGGEGPAREELERANVGLPVELVGHVDVERFLDGVDVFCLPSRWEGLPFVLLDAMMAGRPCVVTDVGDVAEAVDDAAVVVDPGDAEQLAVAIGALLDDPDERRRLGAAAATRAEAHFTVERMVATVAGLYDRIGRR